MRRIAIGPVALAFAATSVAAQGSPAAWVKQLFQPPIDAVTQKFRPIVRSVRPPAAKPPPPVEAETELVDVPMPHLKPASAEPPPTALGYFPDAADDPPVTASAPMSLTPPPPAAKSTCGVSLARLGVEATPLATIDEGACGIAAPVAVASLSDGGIGFSTRAIVGCQFAEHLATWLDDTVEPKAKAILGGEITGVRVAASYACRTRNNQPDTKLSEHAKGNAIDISAIRVGDRWIAVKRDWGTGGAEAEFLTAVRTSACGPFKTVLGPGSDPYHGDHFHLDLAKRRNGSTYCK